MDDRIKVVIPQCINLKITTLEDGGKITLTYVETWENKKAVAELFQFESKTLWAIALFPLDKEVVNASETD